MHLDKLLLIFEVLIALTTLSFGSAYIDRITDDELKDVVSNNEFVLVLFQQDPCVSEDCDGALQETTVVAKSSYIPGLRVVQLINSKLTAKFSLGNRSRLIFYRKTVPILFDSFVIRMDDVVVWLEQNKELNSRYLDTQSFEHLTQAATGATTGDWFILFHQSRCNHLLPLWESVASHLEYRINMAVVDTEISPELKTRFQINRCPTIIYFRLGRMYMYELSTQDIKPFLQFADGWYVNAPSRAVPKEPTPFDVLIDRIVTWLKTCNISQTSLSFAVIFFLVLVVGCFCFLQRKPRKTELTKSD